MTPFEFRTVPHIHVEPGGAERLAHLAGEALRSPRRVLFVTDGGVRKLGLADPAIASFAEAGAETAVFDGVLADPPEAVILDAAERGRAFGADAVIGFGGGSSMDAAKLVAVLLGSDQPLVEMYGVNKVVGPRLPLALVSTTSGTGSEVTPISVVTTGETTKSGVNAPPLYADLALIDPDLTLGLPRAVTAATGIDAMVHAIEAITSKTKRNPVSDALALAALAKLHGALERACADGADRDARADMALGAMLAGQAFANAPVAAVHALAYPLGGIFHVPHGLSNALVLPHVLRFNAPACGADYARIAAHLGLSASAEALIAECERLSEAVKIERRLRDVGVSHNHLPQLAEDAMRQTRLLVHNPREVTYDDAPAVFPAALLRPRARYSAPRERKGLSPWGLRNRAAACARITPASPRSRRAGRTTTCMVTSTMSPITAISTPPLTRRSSRPARSTSMRARSSAWWSKRAAATMRRWRFPTW